MFRFVLSRPVWIVVMWLLSAPILMACGKNTVAVSVHGVNYSGVSFSYYLVDPAFPGRIEAGENIDPFAAGGTTCCFSLPKKWRPGIKVEIHSTYWLPKLPNGLSEIKKVDLVDVPPYGDGQPGELWVLRADDGSMSVISSDFQPDHPKWPGKPKGWPTASLEYRRERWELMREHEQGGVKLFMSLLDELDKDPLSRAKADWEFSQKDEPLTLKEFSGPHDPRYIVYLRKHYIQGLEQSKKLLKDVMDARP